MAFLILQWGKTGTFFYPFLMVLLCTFHLLFFGCRNKKETTSYIEISESLGVDNPAEILFLTDVYQEATAAKAAGNVLMLLLAIFIALLYTLQHEKEP